MKFSARIEITLKAGQADPEGEAVKASLRDLGYDVNDTDTSKVYLVVFHAASREDADVKVEEMCKKLLANPVKDNYGYEIAEEP